MVIGISILVILILLVLCVMLLFLCLELISFIYFYTYKKYTIFVPSHYQKESLKEIFEFIEQNNFKEIKFIDLGSGDGKMTIIFAKNFKIGESWGVDINPFLVFLGKLKAWLLKLKNVKFIRKDIFRMDLSHFNVVYLYQLPSFNQKILPKLEEELLSNSLIISHKFPLPFSEKIQLLRVINKKEFYIYKKIN